MKKVAILSLALTVCLCIASDAFHWFNPTDVYGAQMRTYARIKDAINPNYAALFPKSCSACPFANF